MARNVDPMTGVRVDGPAVAAERRDFIRRAAGVGLPVVLATVSSRTVWANTGESAGASVAPSADAGTDGWIL
jgi:hypothetical protein